MKYVLSLVLLASVFMPGVVMAQVGAGQCGWCGASCQLSSTRQVCPDVIPPEGKSCTKDFGTGSCVVTGTSVVADPTFVACKTRPVCLDENPACNVFKIDSYCPGFSSNTSICGLSAEVGDSFSGTTVDTTKWRVLSGEGLSVDQVLGKVNLAINKTAPAGKMFAGLKSIKKYSGDFEVSVDIDSLSFENGQWSNIDLAISEESKYFASRLIKDVNHIYTDAYSLDNGVVGIDSVGINLTEAKAKLYLLRRGEKLTSFVEVNGKKMVLGSTNMSFNLPVSVTVVLWRESDVSGGSGTIDNVEMRCVGPELGLVGDVNGDGFIDLLDFGIWKGEYLTKTGLRSDFDSSGVVNLIDFGIWKKAYLNN